MNIKELENKLESLKLPVNMTAYRASQIASEFTGKNIRTQMIVNYLGKKYISGVKGADGKWRVDHKSFTDFLERYCFRNLLRVK